MTQMMGTIEATPLQDAMPQPRVERIDRRSGETGTLPLRVRLIELETEHLRLQRLVAELLVKNQKLRELLCEQAGTSAAAASFCPGDGAVGQRAGLGN
jgi:hypothetical protein